MTILKEQHTCADFGERKNVDATWFMNERGEYICEDCADKTPKFIIHQITKSDSRFYGHAEFQSEEITTQLYFSKAEARKRILQMIQKLWGDKSPIEE